MVNGKIRSLAVLALASAMTMAHAADLKVDTKLAYKEVQGQVAAAQAVAAVPQAVKAGGLAVGAGLSKQDSVTGLAVGASYRFKDDKTTIKGTVTKTNESKLGFTAGVGHEF